MSKNKQKKTLPIRKATRPRHRFSLDEKPTIKESFSWVTPDMKYNDAPGKKVKIRGAALFSVEKFFKKGVSKNQKRYILDELRRSARTLKGVPIDVNHEVSLWEEGGKVGPQPSYKGHVEYGEEEGGRIEYHGEINHKEYVEKIRDTDKVRNKLMSVEAYYKKWGKYPLVGVSVDADFLKMKCVHCGQDFYNGEVYRDHMVKEHNLKDISVEPHGIVFKRLSLVEPPERPGVVGADFEIVETQQNGMMKLYETIMGEKHHIVGLTSSASISATPHGVAKVEEGCRWSKMGYSSGAACVAANQDKDDPEAFCYEKLSETEQEEPVECLEGFVFNPDTKKCEKVDYDKAKEMQDNPALTYAKATKAQLLYKYNYIGAYVAKRLKEMQEERDKEKDDIGILVTAVSRLDQKYETMRKAIVEVHEELHGSTTGNPRLKETEDKQLQALEKLMVKVDNLDAKIKGQFKGKSKSLTGEEPVYSDPYKLDYGGQKKRGR